MIVIARNFGQLGNRLLLSANLIAAAREYDVPLRNPSFASYANYFCSTATDLWCRYPTQTSDKAPTAFQREALYRSVYLTGRTLSHLRMTGFPFHVIRLTDDQRCDLQSESFASLAKSGRPVLVSGWKFMAGDWLEKHGDAIRDFYRIQPIHQENVNKLVDRVRKPGNPVVGIHIRQGDYANFENGQYFFTTDQYVASMRRIRDQMSGHDVTFLVCGNGKFELSEFGDLNVHFGTGHLVEDMYSLARVDAIVGPPSTFTRWASFYGHVPIHPMCSADETFDSMRPDHPTPPVWTRTSSVAA